MPFNDFSGYQAGPQRFHRYFRAELMTTHSIRDMHSISERAGEGGGGEKIDDQLVSRPPGPSGCHAAVRESVLPLSACQRTAPDQWRWSS